MTAPKHIESDQRVSAGGASPGAPDHHSAEHLFTQLSLALPQAVACDVCGNPFEIFRQRGRPQRFCGDECRRVQLRRQQAEYHQRVKLDGQRLTESGKSLRARTVIDVPPNQCDAGGETNRDTFDALRDAGAKARGPEAQLPGIALNVPKVTR